MSDKINELEKRIDFLEKIVAEHVKEVCPIIKDVNQLLCSREAALMALNEVRNEYGLSSIDDYGCDKLLTKSEV